MEAQKLGFRRIEAHQEIHLPQEILEQIMVRLPVKSLLRFKCVSKRWRLIITGKNFIKTHLEKSSKDKSLEGRHIIFEKRIWTRCSLKSFLHEPQFTAVDFDYPTCHPSAFIVGSCNGLVCILKKLKKFILWNPSTGKFKKLPSIYHFPENYLETYGFGYDESNDDYKIFGLWTNKQDGVERMQLAKIYSLKMDCWIKVDVPTMDLVFKAPGVFANLVFKASGIFASGKLHWVVNRRDYWEWYIMSFDLENEIYGIVELPNGIEDWFLFHANDGCLCCCSPIRSETNQVVDCWVLKEYGVKDSWYKFATLDCPRLVGDDDRYDDDDDNYIYPSFLGPNGEILGSNYYSFFIFLKEDGRFSSPRVIDSKRNICRTVIYVESLVEP